MLQIGNEIQVTRGVLTSASGIIHEVTQATYRVALHGFPCKFATVRHTSAQLSSRLIQEGDEVCRYDDDSEPHRWKYVIQVMASGDIHTAEKDGSSKETFRARDVIRKLDPVHEAHVIACVERFLESSSAKRQKMISIPPTPPPMLLPSESNPALPNLLAKGVQFHIPETHSSVHQALDEVWGPYAGPVSPPEVSLEHNAAEQGQVIYEAEVSPGVWVPYVPTLSVKFEDRVMWLKRERLLSPHQEPPARSQVDFSLPGRILYQYELTLQFKPGLTLYQVNRQSGRWIPVRRVAAPYPIVPLHAVWQHQKPVFPTSWAGWMQQVPPDLTETLLGHSLSPETLFYQQVLGIFRALHGSRYIPQIQEVQAIVNTSLFSQYAHYSSLLPPTSREEWVVHGTKGEHQVAAIARHGFDRAFNRRSRYGQATYASRHMEFSWDPEFSPVDSGGRKHLLLCRAHPGRICLATSDIEEDAAYAPPGYDSVESADGTILALYQNLMLYPAFHVICRV